MRPRAARRRSRLPIAVLLIFGLSGLVLVAVSSVLYLALWTGQRNTAELARDRAGLIVERVHDRIVSSLDPARRQAAFLGEAIAKQHIDPLRDHRFVDLAAGALAATPQVTGIAFLGPDLKLIRVYRNRLTGAESEITDERANREMQSALQAVSAAPRAFWGDTVWSESVRQPLINLRSPVRDGDKFIGGLFVVLSVADLSASLGDLAEQAGTTAFILVDKTHVLAHPNLVYGVPGLSAENPLPRIDQVRDPILAHIWQPLSFIERERSQALLGDGGSITKVDGQDYLFVYREINQYGTKPWLIGTYMPETTLESATGRIINSLIAGSIIMVAAVLLAWFIGRRLTRQIVALATAAHSIRLLEFAAVTRLKPSRLRELDEAAGAFNAMLDGLRWFEAYVPRALVRRLIRLGETGELQSVERDVTVMFTDIAGFTTLSEQMGAGEVAGFLNQHFGIIDRNVDAEGGTVDKYLGDGVMAFWGAPEMMEDHAERACRAGLAIVAAIEADNRRKRAEGGIPVHLRIGIHTGAVTVGNIGGSSRVSYTIVGDTVNTASRLCELGKEIGHADSEVVALISGETAAAIAGKGFDLMPFGAQVLRGRHGGTEIFRLLGPPPPLPALAASSAAVGTGG